MENCRTLHEICDAVGVTRRAVQGYEKAGLVGATKRNKYGHLLYDEESQKRIAQIKLYQQLGFKVREIKEFIDAPGAVVKAVLERQVLRLKEERTQMDADIYDLYQEIVKEYEKDWFESGCKVNIPMLISRRLGINPQLDK